jgi:hypothetical protein
MMRSCDWSSSGDLGLVDDESRQAGVIIAVIHAGKRANSIGRFITNDVAPKAARQAILAQVTNAGAFVHAYRARYYDHGRGDRPGFDRSGTYDLRQRPGTGDRYMLTPADADKGEFRVTVGTDPIRGRITLLQGPIEAVVMLGATF